jgi:hypothetical protein
MDGINMRDRTGSLQHAVEGVDVASVPVTDGNGSAPARPFVETSDRPRPRRPGGVANIGVAMLCVLIVVVGGSAGYIASLHMPKQYVARAELHYSLAHAEPNELLREDRTLTTQLVLLRSRAVLWPVAAENGLTPEYLEKSVSAKVVDASEIIEVEVRDARRERAQQLLTSIVGRYIAMANSDAKDPVRSYLEDQLRAVRMQRNDVAAARSSATSTALAERERFLVGLLNELKPSATPESLSWPPAQVLTPPYLLAGYAGPTPVFAAAAGGTIGLVVAAFVVLFVAQRRLRS